MQKILLLLSTLSIFAQASAHDGVLLDWTVPKNYEELSNLAKIASYKTAAYLTEPVLTLRDYAIKIQVLDELPAHPWILSTVQELNTILPQSCQCSDLEEVAKTLEKCYLYTGITALSLSTPLAFLGIGLRHITSHLEQEHFIHYRSPVEEKQLADNTFSILLWNICGIEAGYEVTCGGQLPLQENLLCQHQTRLAKIVARLKTLDADVVACNEAFDILDTEYIVEQLRSTYPHIICNCGSQALGTNSGLLLLSKFAVSDIRFDFFPKDLLVGDVKYCGKGVLQVTLLDNQASICSLFLTHLQSSEEPAFPTAEERWARQEQISFIMDKINASSQENVLLLGDLNMDDNEFYQSAPSIYNAFTKAIGYHSPDGSPECSWPGDSWYIDCGASFLYPPLIPRRPSPGVDLDHILVKRYLQDEFTPTISTTLYNVGYDPHRISRDSESDHNLLLSQITIHNR